MPRTARLLVACAAALSLTAGSSEARRAAPPDGLVVASPDGRNSVAVAPFVEQSGLDALRWYFARRCRTRADSDVSLGAVLAAYDGDLADRLGNLVQRCSALATKLCDGRVPPVGHAPELEAVASALPARVDAALDAFVFDDAAAAIVDVVDAANRALEFAAPWRSKDASALYAPLEAARIVAGELAPFVPDAARTIAGRLGNPDLAPSWSGLRPGAELRHGPPPLPRKAA